MDAIQEYPTRDQLRNLALPVKTPHLVDLRKGIWNPQWLLASLSVLSVHNGPYADKQLADGLWEYRYRDGGTEGDNRKLQRAADLEVDLVYFREATPGRYQPEYPVRVIQNNPSERKVLLARKELERVAWSKAGDTTSESLRSWATREVRYRKHQRRFREAVLDAYADRCAMCNMPVRSLLDAAHIDADSSVDGEPVVQNGLALCKLHHHAYDSNLIGISPARRVHVSEHVLRIDGNRMVDQGLKVLHKSWLGLPEQAESHPEQARLSRRWHEFRKAAEV